MALGLFDNLTALDVAPLGDSKLKPHRLAARRCRRRRNGREPDRDGSVSGRGIDLPAVKPNRETEQPDIGPETLGTIHPASESIRTNGAAYGQTVPKDSASEREPKAGLIH